MRRVLFITKFVKAGDFKDLSPRGFEIDPVETRKRACVDCVGSFEHFNTLSLEPLGRGEDILDLKANMGAAHFR